MTQNDDNNIETMPEISKSAAANKGKVIVITDDDIDDVCRYMKALSDDDKGKIGEAIRSRDLSGLENDERAFVRAFSYFTKSVKKQSYINLVKRTFSIDAVDIDYIIGLSSTGDGNFTEEVTAEVSEGMDTEKLVQEMLPMDLPPPENAATAADGVAPVIYAEKYSGGAYHKDKICVPLSKLSQKITEIENKTLTPVEVIPAKKGIDSISIDVTLNTENTTVKYEKPISAFDELVEGIVGNLFEQDFKIVTPEMIFKTMNGITGKRQVSPVAIGRITRSIDRLRKTDITINITEYLKVMRENPERAKWMKDVKAGEIKGNILSGAWANFLFPGGTVKRCFKVYEIPHLYNYSKNIMREVETVPTKILATDGEDGIRADEYTTLAKFYLIRQIARIRRKPQNKRVSYETLLKAIGDNASLEKDENGRETQNARNAKRYRVNMVHRLLNTFQQKGHIKGYKDITEGRKIVSVEIYL